MNDDLSNTPSDQTPQAENGQDPGEKPGGVDDKKKWRAEKEAKETDARMRNEEEAKKIKGDLEHSSAVNRSLLIFFLLAMTYFLVIVASTNDLQLLLPNSTIELPILGTDLNLIHFYLFSPFILIVIHFNFLFSLCQHTKKLTRLKELERDVDDPLPHSSFLINLLIKPRRIRADGVDVKDNRAPYYLIRLLLWIVIYLYPLSILTLFQWRFADYHDLGITFLHFFYIVLDITLLSFFWVRISNPDFKNQPFSIFTPPASKLSVIFRKGRMRLRHPICDRGRDKIDKIVFFLPCLIQKLFSYIKNNTGTVNLVVILLLLIIQLRTFGLLKIIDYMSPGNAYRIVNNYPFLSIPRLVVIGKPIIDHYRKLDLPLPYSDSIGDLKKSIDQLKSEKKPDFSPPTINQLILSGRDLRFAILDGSDLEGAVFKQAQLQGASLTQTILTGANMTKANLKGANLRLSILNNAIFSESHLEEAMLEGATLTGALLEKAYLSGADLTRADLTDALLHGANLTGSIMQNARLNRIKANRAVFRAADLSRADFRDAQLKRVDFCAADLGNAILQGANLTDAILEGVNLEGSNISRTLLRDANLHAANLKNAKIEGTKWTGAKLHSAQISGLEMLINVVEEYSKEKVYGVNVFEKLQIAFDYFKKIEGQTTITMEELLEDCPIKKPDGSPVRKFKADLEERLGSSKIKSIKSSENLNGVKGVEIIFVDNQGVACDPPSEFEVQELIYRLRSEIVCDSVYTAKGILRQMLFEKDLEYQRRRMFSELEKNCPSIAARVAPH